MFHGRFLIGIPLSISSVSAEPPYLEIFRHPDVESCTRLLIGMRNPIPEAIGSRRASARSIEKIIYTHCPSCTCAYEISHHCNGRIRFCCLDRRIYHQPRLKREVPWLNCKVILNTGIAHEMTSTHTHTRIILDACSAMSRPEP